MALGYLLNPALQIEDNDGKPLTGGWLTVYQHGTTIPYITYKDFSGDRNPANIPLDAKGMAVVLASDGFSYDVYCYDRNAVQQWSRLNVTTSVVSVDGLYTFTSSDGTVGITTTTSPNEPTEIDLSAQQLTAGPNIDIINGVVSTEKPVVNAGTNVTITSSSDPSTRIITYNVSAVDTTYSAGSGLNLNGNTFSVDTSTVQPKLTAGNNIYFEGNTINAVDTLPAAGYGLSKSSYNTLDVDTSVIQPKLTAGTNIQISNNNVISATDTTYTAGSGLSLNGTEFSNTAPNVQADWDAAAGSDAEILNKPVIPTVNDGTLTIQKNGANVATFSANQSSGATANITVPTDTSDLTNGAGFITASQVPAQVNADWNASSGAAQILNKPTIPTVNDGTLTIQRNGTAVATFSANQSSAATANITVPTDTSDLTNGAGFITASQIPSQVNADWTASSGVSQILHKPTLATKAYGGSNVELSSLVIDADDPDGYVDVMCDNVSRGKLVKGPYAALLNSGVDGIGDSATPVYINSSGQFDTCTIQTGGKKRHTAELYYHHYDDGDHYNVRNVKNYCINHVAVTNHSADICYIEVEAPTLGSNEEYDYYVVFDCSNSSGGCNVGVQNCDAEIFNFPYYNPNGPQGQPYVAFMDKTYTWVELTGSPRYHVEVIGNRYTIHRF
jgi:hypothetical protein